MQLEKSSCDTEDLVKIEQEHDDISLKMEIELDEEFQYIIPEVQMQTETEDTDDYPNTTPQFPSAFRCEFCLFQYQYQVQYTEHLDSHHPLNYECTFCGSKFRSDESLQMHKRENHWKSGKEYLDQLLLKQREKRMRPEDKKKEKRKPFKGCPICGIKFANEVNLQNHILKHETKPVNLENLSQTLAGQDSEGNNVTSVQEQVPKVITATKVKKRYVCDICGKNFSAYNGFKHHTMKHLGEKPHECVDCGETFVHKQLLFSHQVRQHGHTSPWVCQFCGQIFTTKSGLDSHENRHRGARPYICEVCERTFSSKAGLSLHKADHTPGHYPCLKCGQVFTKRSDFYGHRLFHFPRVKKFFCSLCDYKATTSSALQIHIRTHTGEKPFHCDLCDKCFGNKSSIMYHIRRHFKMNDHKCNECGKRFANHPALVVHIRVHTGEKPHVCRVCNQSFNQLNSLKRHLKLHNAKYHKCDKCGQEFDIKTDLKLHYKNHQ